jgi:hypothetical protein
VHDILDKRTDPTGPPHWFVPRLTGAGAFTDVYSVMNNWGANHGAFVYGHVGADLITFAPCTASPCAWHNVPETEISGPPPGTRSALPTARRRFPRVQELRTAVREGTVEGTRYRGLCPCTPAQGLAPLRIP